MKQTFHSKPLTIALNRGRILDECLPMLALAGIEPIERIEGSRKLVFDAHSGERLVVVRGADVPTYVEYGAADLGITGKDTLLEYGGAGFYERLDLKIASCRIMTAAPKGASLESGSLRVATKFVNIAKRYFAEQGRQVEVIGLSGAMEIAPLMGLADCIVDIVDTGSTLLANGLEARDVIANVSARVIVNRASLKMRFDEIEAVLKRLEGVVESRKSGRG
ncbi:MAG TPA: ATP phosphoribosyltransferase [Pseudomonadales bacterium]|nr:ATP phosphoribosyltransferase [Pseudomonadales bacterium]